MGGNSKLGWLISWNEAKILQIEVNSRQRKYKESAHMACMENPISQPNLSIIFNSSIFFVLETPDDG
jgi:hypothetical protein